ncbi:NAD(P)-dependent oxidoreductase [Kineosporia sp. NBRC 101731]|uniref:NAD-dependent epimerase/dehydratase family protein n=1 Tax=Kineosporia sp. NBRC 101731 TaxID=3032199 RepID=UPI0024A1310B|nr:NAD(P)-dependent oxidoreductase [Kineosporia sp. NBRC 101731]GLY29320.1 putative DTDP-glucose-4,6-dehydratase-related protein [Kineosporia sp. NBRC 101731]
MSRYLVTGSSGHLGEALVRTSTDAGHDVTGIDVRAGEGTTVTGSIADSALMNECLAGVDHVLHTATLHKPHVGSHSRPDFVDVNVTGTLTVLTAAARAGVKSVVFTSSTSTFGRAMTPVPGGPATWIDEDVRPQVKNIYGATKVAAEDLCELAALDGLPVVVLKTSRFFPERDDVQTDAHDTALKVAEFLYRRVDLEDVVNAHLIAATRAPQIGFGRYIISAPTPFVPGDLTDLADDARSVVRHRYPDLMARFEEKGWPMPSTVDRVYDSRRAQADLGWNPRHDFVAVAERALATGEWRSDLALRVGWKGYHDHPTGVYTGP